MLQLYAVYLLWNGRKTLTGSPDSTHMQTVQINLAKLNNPVFVHTVNKTQLETYINLFQFIIIEFQKYSSLFGENVDTFC